MKVQKSLQGIEAEDHDKCPECGGREFDRAHGERYCKKCGYVMD